MLCVYANWTGHHREETPRILATTKLEILAQRYPGELPRRTAAARGAGARLIVEAGNAAAREPLSNSTPPAREMRLNSPAARRISLHHG